MPATLLAPEPHVNLMPLAPDHIDSLARDLSQRWPQPGAEAPRTRAWATIEQVIEEAAGYRRLVLSALPFGERRPGQYVTLTYEGLAPRFLVLASAPGQPWEVLISANSTLGRAMQEQALVGQRVSVSAPEGPGFSPTLWRDDEAPLLAFATGSGIATVRALLGHIKQHTPSKLERTTLYYGESGPDQHAYLPELEQLAQQGLGLRLVHAQDPQVRWVQDAFMQAPIPLEGAQIVLSGAPIMTQYVAAMMLSRGVDIARLHVNIEAVSAPVG